MKKSYLTLAVVAAMMASCTNEILIDEAKQDATPAEINFSTSTQLMTRAENSSAAAKTQLESHHNDFNVWGSKYASSKYQEVWGATSAALVTIETPSTSTTPAIWGASPVKFWDKAASDYYFFAAAPAKDKSDANVGWTLAWKAVDDALTTNADETDYSDAYISLNGFKLAGNNISEILTSQIGTAAVAATIKEGVTLYDASGNTVAATAIVKDVTYYKKDSSDKKPGEDGYSETSAVKDTDYTEPVAASSDYQPAGVANKNIATTFKGATSDLDLMIASPCETPRPCYNKTTPDMVNLEFNHILSRLNVLVKKGSAVADIDVNLTGLTVTMLKEQGNFKENTALDSTTEAFDAADLAVLKAGTTKRWTASALSSRVSYTGKTFNGVDQTPRYVLESLVIPQEIVEEALDVDGTGDKTAAYLKIDYTIAGEEYTGYYNLATVFGAGYKTVSLSSAPESWTGYYTLEDVYTACTAGNKAAKGVDYYTKDENDVYTKANIAVGTDLDGYYTKSQEYTACTSSTTYSSSKTYYEHITDIAFNEGWQNNLTITINPAEIKFTAEVFEWDTNMDEEYQIPNK